jgi:hypothetical protein
MGLEKEQLKEIIQNPINRQFLSAACFHEQRLQMHLDTSISKPADNVAFQGWLRYIGDIAQDNDKFELFQQLIKYPLVSTSLTNNIYRRFRKVFHGADSRRDFRFNNETNKADFIGYISKYKNFFNEQGFKYFKLNPNGFVCIDYPVTQIKGKSEPFIDFVNVNQIHDASVNSNASVNWVLIDLGGQKYKLIDNEKFAIVDHQGNIITDNEGNESVLFHNLGFTPVRQFWTSNINNNNLFLKDVPLNASLGECDFLLSADVGKENVDLYAKFPYLSILENDEDYEDYETTDNVNTNLSGNGEGGYTRNGVSNNYVTDSQASYNSRLESNYNSPRQNKDKKSMRLAGTIFSRRSPKENEVDTPTPFEIITPDTNILKHLTEDVEYRENKIYANTVGTPRQTEGNDSAKNEKQVQSQYEGQLDVILGIKKNFEALEEWVYKTIALMRYESEDIEININYGTRFFIKSVDELEQELKTAKELGASEGFILSLIEEVIDTKYKNSPSEAKKQKLLLALDPFPSMSIMEIADLIKAGVPIMQEDLVLKTNFGSLIGELERKRNEVLENEPFDVNNVRILREQIKELTQLKIKENGGEQSTTNQDET